MFDSSPASHLSSVIPFLTPPSISSPSFQTQPIPEAHRSPASCWRQPQPLSTSLLNSIVALRALLLVPLCLFPLSEVNLEQPPQQIDNNSSSFLDDSLPAFVSSHNLGDLVSSISPGPSDFITFQSPQFSRFLFLRNELCLTPCPLNPLSLPTLSLKVWTPGTQGWWAMKASDSTRLRKSKFLRYLLL